MRKVLLAAALSVAAFTPVPAEAIAAVPCEDGYVGVIVVDEEGQLARVCVRDPR